MLAHNQEFQGSVVKEIVYTVSFDQTRNNLVMGEVFGGLLNASTSALQNVSPAVARDVLLCQRKR